MRTLGADGRARPSVRPARIESVMALSSASLDAPMLPIGCAVGYHGLPSHARQPAATIAPHSDISYARTIARPSQRGALRVSRRAAATAAASRLSLGTTGSSWCFRQSSARIEPLCSRTLAGWGVWVLLRSNMTRNGHGSRSTAVPPRICRHEVEFDCTENANDTLQRSANANAAAPTIATGGKSAPSAGDRGKVGVVHPASCTLEEAIGQVPRLAHTHPMLPLLHHSAGVGRARLGTGSAGWRGDCAHSGRS